MENVGILGYGVYIPKYRIKGEEYAKAWGYFAAAGVREKSVPRFDEDATTMAVEAAKNAIKCAEIDPSNLGAIYVGTTSSPYSEKLLSSTLASAIGVPKNVALADFKASSKAGTTALLSCADFLRAGRGKYGLVVASDAPMGYPADAVEHAFGAASASYVLGTGAVIAELEDAHQVGFEMWGGRFRRSGEKFVSALGVTRFESMEYEQTIAPAVKQLLQKTNLKQEDIDYVVLQQPDALYPFRVSRALGFKTEQVMPGIVASILGDVGACSTLLGLAAVLDEAKEEKRILVASYGSGTGSDALLLITRKSKALQGKIPSVKDYFESRIYLDYITYLRWRRMLQSSFSTG